MAERAWPEQNSNGYTLSSVLSLSLSLPDVRIHVTLALSPSANSVCQAS